MSNYIGNKCPVCGEAFVEGDDIVVCPECGTPHHRACYAKDNKCANEKNHGTGNNWVSANNAEPAQATPCIDPADGGPWNGKEMESKTCPHCGSKNPVDNIFCCSCGNRLSGKVATPPQAPPQTFGGYVGVDPTTAMYGGVSPQAKIDDYSAADVAMFVGRSSSYYVPHFKAESEESKRFSFMFSPFAFTFIYFFYRKMNKIGALVLALAIILAVPQFLYINEGFPLILKDTVGVQALEDVGIDITPHIDNIDMAKMNQFYRLTQISTVLSLLLRIACGMFAVKLYYRHTLKKLGKIYEIDEVKNARSAIVINPYLRKAGGVNTWVVPVIIIGMLVLSVGYSSFLTFSLMKATSASGVSTALFL